MRRLCIRAKELQIPLEYNLYGLGDGRNYPNPLFWEVAAEVGNQAILGCDAHKVESVCPGTVIAAAEAQLEKLGITVLPDLEDFLVK
jgi:histidinol-phosphatase (PHP family)